MEPLCLELHAEVAPVGHGVAADGVVLGKPRPEHAGRDLVCDQDRHVVDFCNAPEVVDQVVQGLLTSC